MLTYCLLMTITGCYIYNAGASLIRYWYVKSSLQTDLQVKIKYYKGVCESIILIFNSRM